MPLCRVGILWFFLNKLLSQKNKKTLRDKIAGRCPKGNTQLGGCVTKCAKKSGARTRSWLSRIAGGRLRDAELGSGMADCCSMGGLLRFSAVVFSAATFSAPCCLLLVW